MSVEVKRMPKISQKLNIVRLGVKSYIAFFFVSLAVFNNLNSLEVIFMQNEEVIQVSNPQGSNDLIYERYIPLQESKNPSLFNLDISFQSTRGSPNFTNILQTQREGRGLRIEQQFIGDNAQLFVQYRDFSNSERYFLVKHEYDPFEKNLLRIEKNTSNRLKIWLNGFLISNSQIGAQGIEFEEFAIGTGLSKSRNFHGNIQGSYLIQFFSAKPIFPYEIFLGIWFLVVALTTILKRRKKNKSLKSRLDFKDFGISLFLALLGVLIQSKKQYAAFFGDDFITLWPVRNISLYNIFTESIGGTYRPITETLFLIRYKLHGEDLTEWRIGNLLIVGLVVSGTFLVLRLLNLSLSLATLGTSFYMTSTTFFGSMFWWSANGTQHGLSQLLTLIYIVVALRAVNDQDRQYYYNLHLLGLLMFLVSDLFAPLLIVSSVLAFIQKWNMRSKIQSRKKRTQFTHRKEFWCVAKFSLLTILVVLFFRNILANLDLATAAVSAANFKFDSIDLGSFVTQFAKYLLSFLGIVVGYGLYDIGASNGRLSPVFDYPDVVKLCIVVNLGVYLVGFLGKQLSLARGVREFKVKLDWNNLSIVSREKIILLCLSVLCLIPPALVPGYMQQRWTQLSLLCLLIVVLKSNSNLLVLCIMGMVGVQIYQLHLNYGISWF